MARLAGGYAPLLVSSGDLTRGACPDTPRVPPALGQPDPLGPAVGNPANHILSPELSWLVAEAEAQARDVDIDAHEASRCTTAGRLRDVTNVVTGFGTREWPEVKVPGMARSPILRKPATARFQPAMQVADAVSVKDVGIQCVNRKSLANNVFTGEDALARRKRLASILRPHAAPRVDAGVGTSFQEDDSLDNVDVDDAHAVRANATKVATCDATNGARATASTKTAPTPEPLRQSQDACVENVSRLSEQSAESSASGSARGVPTCGLGVAGGGLADLQYPSHTSRRVPSEQSRHRQISLESRAALAEAFSRAVAQESSFLDQAWSGAEEGSAAAGALGLLRRIATKAERSFALNALKPAEASRHGAAAAAARDVDMAKQAAGERREAEALARSEELEARLRATEERLDMLRAKVADSIASPSPAPAAAAASPVITVEALLDADGLDSARAETLAAAAKAQSVMEQCMGRLALVKTWQQQDVNPALLRERAELVAKEEEVIHRLLLADMPGQTELDPLASLSHMP